MRQQVPFVDTRLYDYCYACGDVITDQTRTIEHVPARLFLDRPYPDNLATVFSCFACNNGTSADEQFVGCLLEAVRVGSADPQSFERGRVRDSVQKSPAIAQEIDSTFSSDRAWDDATNGLRLRAVIQKLARGHAMYDLADPRSESPETTSWFRLDEAPEEQIAAFENWMTVDTGVRLFPEVGSRALLRWFDGREEQKTWFTVQQDRYRYSYRVDVDALRVRLVLRGFLACEVSWSNRLLADIALDDGELASGPIR